MIVELILTALFLGWILHGKFGRLADVKIRYAWMIFVPLGLYLCTLAANYRHAVPDDTPIFGVVHVLEFLALIVVTVANRAIPGAWLMFAGLVINLIAVAANGGMLPTSIDGIRIAFGPGAVKYALSTPQVRHAFIDASTRLKLLCDVIPAPWPFVLMRGVYSIGDVVTSVGGLIAIVAIMRTPLPSEKRTASEA